MSIFEGIGSFKIYNKYIYILFSCSSLKELDLSSFHTINVTVMSYMFSNSRALNEINLSHFNTKNVLDISYMFT